MDLSRTLLLFAALFLAVSASRAQRWQRPAGWGRRRPVAPGQAAMSPRLRQLMALPVNPDTNGDCLIDDEEARIAAEEDVKRLADLLERFSRDFDTDGDGVLGPEERKRLENNLYDRGRKPPRILEKLDTNHDWRLSDEEKEQAREHLTAVFKRRNQQVLERFDANGNGKLDEEEKDKARAFLDSLSASMMAPGHAGKWKNQRRPRPAGRGGW